LVTEEFKQYTESEEEISSSELHSQLASFLLRYVIMQT